MAHLSPFQVGSTSKIIRIQPGVVLKCPHQFISQELNDSAATSFANERQIFEILGKHPRIVTYLGWQDKPELPSGLLLAEAHHGDLQTYLDERTDTISFPLRKKWYRQVIEAIAYIHHQGVIHSDLRPENFLVTGTSIDICLCDFGGSACQKLGLNGINLPDSGFFNPNLELVPSNAMDLFSMASVLYTILIGHWPYRQPGGRFELGEEMMEYSQMVDDLFQRCEFPDVASLWGGNIIIKCWMNEYADIDHVLRDLAMLDG
ncbi:kinase-like protein [Daldinia sp. FL1419]|nr:kinase-like protein [Daldinia sp. FL1419]